MNNNLTQLDHTMEGNSEKRTGDNIRRPDNAYLGQDQNQPPRHAQSGNSLPSANNASLPSVANAGDGADGDAPEELAWGPAHPCFPHMNPHVPTTSDEYANTRVIRIRRDWMVKGDLAPTFSNLYPEILDPLLSEQEFRTVIAKINEELVRTFDPYRTRNWIDGAVGLLTGWIWDDVGANHTKSEIRSLEQWLEKWNQEVGVKEGVKLIPLRRTGYLTLDIQIPDPKIGVVPESEASRPNTGGYHPADDNVDGQNGR